MMSYLRKLQGRIGCGAIAFGFLVCACEADPTGTGANGGVEGAAYLQSDVPLAGVGLYLVQGDTLRREVSDLDGRFAFRNLREGQYWIHVDPPEGYTRPDAEPGPIAVGVPRARTIPVTIVLLNETPRGSIVVTTLADSVAPEAPDSALPVAGVTVRLFASASLESLMERQTGNQGLAVFSVDSGTYDVDVVPPPGVSMAGVEPARITGIRVSPGLTVHPQPFRISTQE